jgi:hypothetical protein
MKAISPRPTSILPETLRRHLDAYGLAASTAGVGVLALVGSAEAKIVYTPTHVKLTPNSGAYNFDLNNDGVTDFTIGEVYYRHFSTLSWGEISGPLGNKWVAKKEGNRSFFPLYMIAGKMIGPTLYSRGRFRSGYEDVFLVRWSNAGFYGWANDGKGVVNRYLGLRFAINGAYHYGWARMSVRISSGASETIITGYAYETVADKGIIAGETKGPDASAVEPTSLGQLAAGASGIPARRVRQPALTTH